MRPRRIGAPLEEILNVYNERVKIYDSLMVRDGKKVIAHEEYVNTRLTRDKYFQEVIAKKEAINLAVNESQASDINYYYHEIRCKIPGESIIKFIYKNQGEGVKNLEPIMQLYNIGKLRAQGTVEAQFFGLLYEGQRVIIEPGQDVGRSRCSRPTRAKSPPWRPAPITSASSPAARINSFASGSAAKASPSTGWRIPPRCEPWPALRRVPPSLGVSSVAPMAASTSGIWMTPRNRWPNCAISTATP